MNDYLAAILFFFPAAVGNSWPVVAAKISWLKNWDTPMDFGKHWRGKRLLGTNKTWRGFITGTLAAGICAVIIGWLFPNTVAPANQFVVGLLLGSGALLGDALESFAKRQLNIAPGNSWFPFDQIDYVIGGLLAVSLVVSLPLWVIVTNIFFYFVLHIVSVYVFYKLGVRDKPI